MAAAVLAPSPTRRFAMAFLSVAIIILCLSAKSVSTFVIAPLPGARLNLAPTPTTTTIRRRLRHDNDGLSSSSSTPSDEYYSSDRKDAIPTASVDENRRKLILVAPSALSLLLLNSEDASSTASASTTVTTDMDTTMEVMDNNANIIQMLDQPSSTPQQINTAISSSTSASSRGGGVLCADVEEASRIAIFERVAPSVVYIDTFSEKRDVFSTNVLEVPVGSGSGFIWDKNGHIVTNFHVIQEAKSAQVAILTSGGGGASSSTIIQPAYTSVRPGALGINGSTVLPNYTRVVYKAKVIGVDPTKDIAVLKVEDTDAPILGDLRPIEVGTSTGLRVGQGSLAIGNPFGLDHTLT
jgi:hypothetical protein